jgi:tetratricopeptide (TPR) repeat protein
VLLLPWLGERWADQAFFNGDPKLANRARGVDPLLVQPYWVLADASNSYANAVYYFGLATKKQPDNAQAWLYKAEFELENGCARAALQDFYKFNALDPYERRVPHAGPLEYDRALALVNSGKPKC